MVNTEQNEGVLQQRGGEEVAAHVENGIPFAFSQKSRAGSLLHVDLPAMFYTFKPSLYF